MSAKKSTATKKPAGKSASKSSVFTAEERAAMRDYVKERKAEANRQSADDARKAVLDKIAAMAAPDRVLAKRVHEIVTSTAPDLAPRLWYGMPAYARDGNVVCFFQDAKKFKSRYATLGFSDKATLDEGEMWPTGFALTKLTPAAETRIAALVRKAVGGGA